MPARSKSLLFPSATVCLSVVLTVAVVFLQPRNSGAHGPAGGILLLSFGLIGILFGLAATVAGFVSLIIAWFVNGKEKRSFAQFAFMASFSSIFVSLVFIVERIHVLLREVFR